MGEPRIPPPMWAVASGNAVVYQAGRDINLGAPAYRLERLRPGPSPLSFEDARRRPGRLLAARQRVVGFSGRAAELGTLTRWRDTSVRAAVRLVNGTGGQGKTRLAERFAEVSADAGWTVLVARQGHTVPRAANAEADSDRLLVLIDYAERWILDDLLQMMHDLAGPDRGRVRFLLTARPVGMWWYGLAHRLENDLDLSTEAMSLPVLAASRGRRRAEFVHARDCFAAAMGVTDAEAVPPPAALADDAYSVALTIHMAALAAVDAHLHAETAPEDPGQLSEYLLGREYDHWRELHARPGDLPAVAPVTMGRTVFAASLTGPHDHAQGTALLQRAGLAADRAAAQPILDRHARCYPPQDPATVLEPLTPDRLAEDFLALRLPGLRSGQAADPWAATALRDLLEQPPARTRQALTMLIETAARWRHVGRDHLYPLLTEHPRLALAAGGAALVTLAETPHLDPAVLEAINPLLPDHHVDLDIGAAACVERLTAERLATTTDPAEQSRLHYSAGVRQGIAGLAGQAAPRLQRAVDDLARLPDERLPEVRNQLAAALFNLGIAFLHQGQYQAAADRLQRAAAIYALHDAVDQLAMCADMLQAAMAHLGDQRQALVLATQAEQVLRKNCSALPESQAVFGRAVLNLGNRLASYERKSEALEKSTEAVGVFRRLVEDDRDAYAPDLARALVNHAQDLADAGRTEQAVEASAEAVRLHQAMCHLNPVGYHTDLFKSLVSHCAQLARLGRHTEMADLAAEALRMTREPPAGAVPLPTSLNAAGHAKVATWLLTVDEAKASEIARKALELTGTVEPTDSSEHRRTLARSLMPMGLELGRFGRRSEAIPALEAAAALYRRLGPVDPEGQSVFQITGYLKSLTPERFAEHMSKLGSQVQQRMLTDRPPAPPSRRPVERVQPKRTSRRKRRKGGS